MLGSCCLGIVLGILNIDRRSHVRNILQTEDLHRLSGTSLRNSGAGVIGHRSHASPGGASNNDVLFVQCSISYDSCGHRTSPLGEVALDDYYLQRSGWIGTEVLHLRHQKNHL